jgi:hypothetical protein
MSCGIHRSSADPGESNDLNAQNPSAATKKLVLQMETKYRGYCAGFFQSSHIFLEPEKRAHPNCTTVLAYCAAHHGFRGPICS